MVREIRASKPIITMTIDAPVLPQVTKLWKKSVREEKLRKGVLIVDDEPAFCDMIAEVISAIGYKTWKVHSAEAAMDAWAKDGGEMGLALVDVVMPAVDGLTLIAELRRRDPRIQMVLVSGRLDEDTRWLASESGCLFVSKPFEVSELTELIEELLGSLSSSTD